MFTSASAKQRPQLQAVMEGFVDGILILTEYGNWVQANEAGLRICRQFVDETRSNLYSLPAVPKPIWQVCMALIDSRSMFPQHQFVLESEIVTPAQVKLRVRAQWLFEADRSIDTPCLLVVLEDCSPSSQRLAWSMQKYSFTSRQAEVWTLRQIGCSYEEIGKRLYISQNTVKKHLKDAYAKVREVQDWEEAPRELSGGH